MHEVNKRVGIYEKIKQISQKKISSKFKTFSPYCKLKRVFKKLNKTWISHVMFFLFVLSTQSLANQLIFKLYEL